jgi:hypothetical protein
MPALETISTPEAAVSVQRHEQRTSVSHSRLKMLDLPPRGDLLARRWFLWGVGFYIAFAAVLLESLVVSAPSGTRMQALGSLLGFGTHVNVALFFLVLAGVILTVAATRKVLSDIAEMRREEIDIEWVIETEKDGLLFVFADPAKRRALFDKPDRSPPETDVSVETLMDDRVRRVHAAAVSRGAGVALTELQSIAEVRTARYGSFARYSSSLLLLLAVLGTFAGVKTALPSLIDALGDKNLSTSSLTIPLNAVAGAFGGNALALVGAIAVGLMAQGIGFGRRNLLERLELVSSEYLYGEGTTSDTNPLQAAVSALRDTASQIHAATGIMAGIEGGLHGLGLEFRTSFNSLADRLHDIAASQEEGLYEKTAGALEALQGRVADVAKLIEANALAHAGLVTSVQERGEESRAAIGHMKEANQRLSSALDAFIKVGERADRSFVDLRQASDTLMRSSDGVVKQVETLAQAVTNIRPGLDGLGKNVLDATERMKSTGDESRTAWLSVSEEITRKLREPPRTAVQSSSQPASTRTSVDADLDTLALLQRIAQATESGHSDKQNIFRAAIPSLIGSLIGGGLVFALLRFL